MRTLTQNFYHRLTKQAEEAKTQGLVKEAKAIEDQLDFYDRHLRSDQEQYSYNYQDLQPEVNFHLMSAFLRIADFYNASYVDSKQLIKLAFAMSEDMIKEFRNVASIENPVGPYEDVVAGQDPQIDIEWDNG